MFEELQLLFQLCLNIVLSSSLGFFPYGRETGTPTLCHLQGTGEDISFLSATM